MRKMFGRLDEATMNGGTLNDNEKVAEMQELKCKLEARQMRQDDAKDQASNLDVANNGRHTNARTTRDGGRLATSWRASGGPRSYIGCRVSLPPEPMAGQFGSTIRRRNL